MSPWVEELRPWKEILGGGGGGGFMDEDGDDALDLMTRLLTGPVIQPLRTELTTRWDPREAEPALRFFDAWTRVLPAATAHGQGLTLVHFSARRKHISWHALGA